ncbi:ankyrin repeat domain-containing protein [Brachyspira alvinipulli]|uniref:ankyrin repeat domain-containing protein n=1 Tax=Brachyspira alvinipulli TaxID=84379 RepID=UPI0004862AC1|nr:ankyrin repeat domain-containing protein [Brachyspira alvinipulli]
MSINTIIIIVIVSIVILWPILKKAARHIKIDNSEESIHIACLYGDLPKIKRLLESGVNINSKDFSNKTPLMYAAEDGAIDTIDYLIRNGANINDIDVRGDSALIIALKNNNVKASKLLIEKGANLYIKNEDDKDALSIASDIDSKEMIEFIKNKRDDNKDTTISPN